MGKLFTTLIRQIPFIKKLINERDALVKERNTYTAFVPPGHFYSPIPSISEIMADEHNIWNTMPLDISGIDLHTSEQFALLSEFEAFYNELPFNDTKTEGLRYYYDNISYSYSDAIFLYCMIRHLRPKHIIEVGSGHS